MNARSHFRPGVREAATAALPIANRLIAGADFTPPMLLQRRERPDGGG